MEGCAREALLVDISERARGSGVSRAEKVRVAWVIAKSGQQDLSIETGAVVVNLTLDSLQLGTVAETRQRPTLNK